MSMKTPTEAREAAERILSGRKYRDSTVKTPFNGPLQKLGRGVSSFFRRIGQLISDLFPGVGGPVAQNLIIGVLVITFAVILAKYLLKRQRRLLRTDTNDGSTLSSNHWDRLADEAYANGDFRSAIVYRFRSGIVRLEQGPQPAAARQPNSTLASSAPSKFPPLGKTFDGIRYGNEPGSPAEADFSKQQWPDVVYEARRGVLAEKAATKNRRNAKIRGRRDSS
jgi:hypothetical protein